MSASVYYCAVCDDYVNINDRCSHSNSHYENKVTIDTPTPKDRKELEFLLGDSDILTDLEAAGLAVVPVEPTDEMVEAAEKVDRETGANLPSSRYLKIAIAANPYREDKK